MLPRGHGCQVEDGLDCPARSDSCRRQDVDGYNHTGCKELRRTWHAGLVLLGGSDVGAQHLRCQRSGTRRRRRAALPMHGQHVLRQAQVLRALAGKGQGELVGGRNAL